MKGSVITLGWDGFPLITYTAPQAGFYHFHYSMLEEHQVSTCDPDCPYDVTVLVIDCQFPSNIPSGDPSHPGIWQQITEVTGSGVIYSTECYTDTVTLMLATHCRQGKEKE
ncbi:MAG: hypothetical protein AB1480_13480 [Nitrospirota bacterium]